MLIETEKNLDWIAICNNLNIPVDSTLAMVRGAISYIQARNTELERENQALLDIDDVFDKYEDDYDEEYWNYTAEDENTEIGIEDDTEDLDVYDDES